MIEAWGKLGYSYLLENPIVRCDLSQAWNMLGIYVVEMKLIITLK
jgi:hypothetical protein